MLFFRRNISSYSDSELVRLYKETGESDYFGELYNRYIPLVYGLCLKYLRAPEDAEDAVMQLFEELSDKIKHYEISNFKTWLYSVAKNHCLQLLRRDAREFPTDWNTLVAESGEFLDLLEEEGDEEQLKALHHCLDRLPEEQRVSICEFFLSEKSYAEIAEQTGYVLKSVKSYIQNGKRNLKLCIEKTTKDWGYCPI